MVDCSAEFEKLGIDGSSFYETTDGLLTRLDCGKLNRILKSNYLCRRIYVNEWLKEIERVLEIRVKLKLVGEGITPYMEESGVICFSRKDLYRRERLFMLLSHEAAHFILMRLEHYRELKASDTEYRRLNCDNARMNAPIEYFANVITLMLLEKCYLAEKNLKRQKSIEQLIISLKKQLTR